MVVTENWAVSKSRIQEFFKKNYDCLWENGSCRIGEVEVTLSPLPDNQILKVPIPRTEIRISGPDTEAAEIHRKFVLNFLSAGG